MKRSAKFLYAICSLVVCFALFGCEPQQSSSNNESETSLQKIVSGKDFAQGVAEGLQARWAITDPIYDSNKEPTAGQFAEAVDAEYDGVSQFKGSSFETPELQNAAETYIKSIEDVKAIEKYYSNAEKWQQKYSEDVYQTRVAAIYKINKLSPICVGTGYQADLDDVLADGETAMAAQEFLDKVKFKESKNESGWKTYSTTLENTSETDFSYFAFNINLENKNGVTIDTETASTENWKSGTKHQFDFSTDENFAKISVESTNWNL